jgi:hypothetical protein
VAPLTDLQFLLIRVFYPIEIRDRSLLQLLEETCTRFAIRDWDEIRTIIRMREPAETKASMPAHVSTLEKQ